MQTRTTTRTTPVSDLQNRLIRSAVVVGAIAMLVALAGPAAADELEWIFESTGSIELTNPELPPYPIHLIIDDDTPEGVFGVGVQSAQQFLWFNRFANPGPVQLEEIWVLFPAGANMTVGAEVQLAVYHDPDGDPSNGADLLATYPETIQAVDGVTFSVYTLPDPIYILADGDILVGVVDRFVESGVTSPTTPAAMDTTASQGRSWLAVWSDDPPDPPLLPPDGTYGPVDLFQPGNWMIRAFGTPIRVDSIPALDWRGLTILILLLSTIGCLAARSFR